MVFWGCGKIVISGFSYLKKMLLIVVQFLREIVKYSKHLKSMDN